MWTKLEVYNGSVYIGSFYTNSVNKSDIVADVNKEYGIGKWTRYNIGN